MRGPFLVLLFSLYALGQVAQLRERGRQGAGVARDAAAVIDWPKDDQAWLARLRARPEAVLAVRRAAAQAIERADDLLGT